MNTTVDALKALHAALGGTAADVANLSTIPEIIAAIVPLAATIAAGSTAELPSVSGDDNGKILTVSSGKWAAALPASQLPAVTGDDDNKVLTVVSGAWAAANLPE